MSADACDSMLRRVRHGSTNPSATSPSQAL